MEILLDTTFLLPIVGVRVREVEEIMEKLWIKYRRGEVKVYYTDLNMLEIAWKLSKTSYNPVIREGLLSIERNFTKIPLRHSSLLKALELKRKGFNDLIDLLLYTTAQDNDLMFLTLDRTLVNFLRSIGENVDIVLTSI
ncbi:PIN domain-containing protein [Caldivirga sp.]|uniref:PIN domain-containing protein n=1 Tax=Caldivirga sp. TaxID=2080243 RepID=UPI003D0A0217